MHSAVVQATHSDIVLLTILLLSNISSYLLFESLSAIVIAPPQRMAASGILGSRPLLTAAMEHTAHLLPLSNERGPPVSWVPAVAHHHRHLCMRTTIKMQWCDKESSGSGVPENIKSERHYYARHLSHHYKFSKVLEYCNNTSKFGEREHGLRQRIFATLKERNVPPKVTKMNWVE